MGKQKPSSNEHGIQSTQGVRIELTVERTTQFFTFKKSPNIGCSEI